MAAFFDSILGRWKMYLIEVSLIVIIIFLFFLFFGFPKSGNNSQTVIKPGATPFSVSSQTFVQGYTTPVVTIKNLATNGWSKCELNVNTRYVYKIDSFPGSLDPQSTLTIPTSSFILPNGQALDALSEPMKTMCILCYSPEYINYCWENT